MSLPKIPNGYKMTPDHSPVFTEAQLRKYGRDCVKASKLAPVTKALKLALELLMVATFQSPALQAKRTKVIAAGLAAIEPGMPRSTSTVSPWKRFTTEQEKPK